eukprot:g10232.t1
MSSRTNVSRSKERRFSGPDTSGDATSRRKGSVGLNALYYQENISAADGSDGSEEEPLLIGGQEWDGTDSYYGDSLLLRSVFVLAVLSQAAAGVCCILVCCRDDVASLYLSGARQFSWLTLIASVLGVIVLFWNYDTHIGLYYCCITLTLACLSLMHFIDLNTFHRGEHTKPISFGSKLRVDILLVLISNSMGFVAMSLMRHDHYLDLELIHLRRSLCSKGPCRRSDTRKDI